MRFLLIFLICAHLCPNCYSQNKLQAIINGTLSIKLSKYDFIGSIKVDLVIMNKTEDSINIWQKSGTDCIGSFGYELPQDLCQYSLFEGYRFYIWDKNKECLVSGLSDYNAIYFTQKGEVVHLRVYKNKRKQARFDRKKDIEMDKPSVITLGKNSSIKMPLTIFLGLMKFTKGENYYLVVVHSGVNKPCIVSNTLVLEVL